MQDQPGQPAAVCCESETWFAKTKNPLPLERGVCQATEEEKGKQKLREIYGEFKKECALSEQKFDSSKKHLMDLVKLYSNYKLKMQTCELEIQILKQNANGVKVTIFTGEDTIEESMSVKTAGQILPISSTQNIDPIDPKGSLKTFIKNRLTAKHKAQETRQMINRVIQSLRQDARHLDERILFDCYQKGKSVSVMHKKVHEFWVKAGSIINQFKQKLDALYESEDYKQIDTLHFPKFNLI